MNDLRRHATLLIENISKTPAVSDTAAANVCTHNFIQVAFLVQKSRARESGKAYGKAPPPPHDVGDTDVRSVRVTLSRSFDLTSPIYISARRRARSRPRDGMLTLT